VRIDIRIGREIQDYRATAQQRRDEIFQRNDSRCRKRTSGKVKPGFISTRIIRSRRKSGRSLLSGCDPIIVRSCCRYRSDLSTINAARLVFRRVLLFFFIQARLVASRGMANEPHRLNRCVTLFLSIVQEQRPQNDARRRLLAASLRSLSRCTDLFQSALETETSRSLATIRIHQPTRMSRNN